MATHSLPGKSQGQRSLAATVNGVAKESHTTEQLNTNQPPRSQEGDSWAGLLESPLSAPVSKSMQK